jgi:hypothetical protein
VLGNNFPLEFYGVQYLPYPKEIPSIKLQKTAAVPPWVFGAWSFFGIWCLEV